MQKTDFGYWVCRAWHLVFGRKYKYQNKGCCGNSFNRIRLSVGFFWREQLTLSYVSGFDHNTYQMARSKAGLKQAQKDKYRKPHEYLWGSLRLMEPARSWFNWHVFKLSWAGLNNWFHVSKIWAYTHIELIADIEFPFWWLLGYQPLDCFRHVVRFGSRDDFNILLIMPSRWHWRY